MTKHKHPSEEVPPHSQNTEPILYRIVPEQVRFMREWVLEYHEVPTQPT